MPLMYQEGHCLYVGAVLFIIASRLDVKFIPVGWTVYLLVAFDHASYFPVGLRTLWFANLHTVSLGDRGDLKLWCMRGGVSFSLPNCGEHIPIPFGQTLFKERASR